MKQRELEQQKLKEMDFPQNALEVLDKYIQAPEMALMIPQQEQYLYSQIFQLPDCDEFAQVAFSKDYQRYIEWKMAQLRWNSEFALVHLPPSKDQPVDWSQIAEEEYDNRIVNQRILKHRAKPNSDFKAEEFKHNAMKDMAKSGEVSEFRKSMQKTFQSNKSKQTTPRAASGSMPMSPKSAHSSMDEDVENDHF